jgi:hypothetical protein
MYAWQQPYFELISENDEAQMSLHLMEALSSIEQRLLSPIDEASDEYKVIRDTLGELQRLLAKRSSTNGAKVKEFLV